VNTAFKPFLGIAMATVSSALLEAFDVCSQPLMNYQKQFVEKPERVMYQNELQNLSEQSEVSLQLENLLSAKKRPLVGSKGLFCAECTGEGL